MVKIAVLVSGGGSNFQAILDAIESGYLKEVQVSCVLADRDCYALERAKNYGIESHILKKIELASFLEGKDLDLIVLAGYLSIIPKEVIEAWKNKIINIHPALLPKFGGKGMHGIHVHEAVLTAKEKISGCTVHYVNEDIDAGEILGQEVVEVYEEDSPESLQARVLEKEHLLLPKMIRKIKEERKNKLKKRALISVFYKENIVEFSKFLIEQDYEILSTGGTYKHLKENGLPVLEVSEVTKMEEMLDGRVKTLHPMVHGGILAIRDNKEHMSCIESLGIHPIDMVIVNLYPFFEKVKSDLSFEEKVEFIDIGGPTMLRSAAKSFQDVVVITETQDYSLVMKEIKEEGKVSFETRKRFAGKVFNLTSAYDAAISSFLLEEEFPKYLNASYEKKMDLRYGENPHQKAAYYLSTTDSGAMKNFVQKNGKELSFNNIRDMDVAWKVVQEFTGEIACCGLKHSTPCGVAVGNTVEEAYQKAYSCDPTSIFGGIVAFNQEVNEATAEELIKIFLEIVIAPSYTEKALEILSSKKNLRVIECSVAPQDRLQFVKVDGGLLVQEEDQNAQEEQNIITENSPTKEEMEDLLFGMKVVKHVKSNAIVVVKNKMALGIGTGEVNRIWATEQAIERAGEGLVLASDAFFPFRDVVDCCAKNGIKAIIQPGGSLKDQESIDACNEHGISMIVTGVRHFKH